MDELISSRNERDCRLFRHWSTGVRTLAEVDSSSWDVLKGAWSEARWAQPYVVASWYRGSSVLSRNLSPVVWAVVARCLGHRLDRRLVCRFPRVAALCSSLFFKGRWREAEDSIGGDVVACYFYASALGGRLPDHLHNRLILEWSGEFAARRYLEEFCGSAQNSR